MCVCCVCVFVYVYVVGWFGRLVCRVEQSPFQVEGEGTFTNCNFTSNEAKEVSLEEEHADKSETYMIY